MSTMIADDAVAIRKRMEEIRSARLQHILGAPLEEASKPEQCSECGSSGMEAFCARAHCPKRPESAYGYGGLCAAIGEIYG
jgi:hypothetical protein